LTGGRGHRGRLSPCLHGGLHLRRQLQEGVVLEGRLALRTVYFLRLLCVLHDSLVGVLRQELEGDLVGASALQSVIDWVLLGFGLRLRGICFLVYVLCRLLEEPQDI
jgi:hypothetical protein